ncbi:mitochondrial ubiquinone biosynthesis Coq7 (demethoxyubiquinone monooxygenase) [Andalucia godoyi]|uniref:5-demethoxyubiquinone hydroxylase, mitochondrial n=1 Tax=Andalucia godoyi TaxID=505711 RepID=A0A8K0AHY5_ANDGO|nr:mitochondrial ubiquinone biosynthesis Coq7 (demethoxyubiquinone monooxygenase) [Andalucia godoyi]|eukprot:ANDGO_01283.mRNA.1 mitochondrial ubiquinone biosynthesis Coq7 (demethoxyubiquinone monooxygenase)
MSGIPRRCSSAVSRLLRVDMAGEIGAVYICRGQLAVLRDSAARSTVSHILSQEQTHLSAFEELVRAKRARPSVLNPLWKRLAFGIGVVTAALGPQAAMACHEAVETVIASHYNDQLRELHRMDATSTTTRTQSLNEDAGEGVGELRETVRRFRDEEEAHRELGTAGGAASAPMYPILSNVIRAGCKIAIQIAQKL